MIHKYLLHFRFARFEGEFNPSNVVYFTCILSSLIFRLAAVIYFAGKVYLTSTRIAEQILLIPHDFFNQEVIKLYPG